MAHFYGAVRSSNGHATRLGDITGGVITYAAAPSGGVQVTVWHDPEAQQDMVEVRMTKHRGHGVERELYRGPISGAPAVSDTRLVIRPTQDDVTRNDAA